MNHATNNVPFHPATPAVGFLMAAAVLSLPSSAAGQSLPPLQYPETRTMDVVEDYHGTLVSDPYRWVEEMDSPEVRQWVTMQNALTHDFLGRLRFRQRVHDRIADLRSLEQATPPVRRGERYFYRYSDGTQEQTVLYWQVGLTGAARTLIDPSAFSEDGSITLAGFSPSTDGRLVAYLVQERGRRSIRVRDVDTGHVGEARGQLISARQRPSRAR